ncbi:MAG: glycosyltransferase family 39 protein [Planctomycetes bacterium]|nr:glycosyltransferase family 39 protein [Planctomycetota bacterium]
MTRSVQVLCFLAITIVFVLHTTYLGVVAEDAFISFRFARNLASGNGLVWNVGEPPVEGYTNFLWVIISAAALRAGLDVGLFTQIIGVLAGLVCMVYSYLFCRQLLGLGPRLSLLPCAYLAVAGPFATWATSGMETNLFAMLVLSSTYYMVLYWHHRKPMALCLGFLLAILATLTRPEGFGIFCILLGMHSLRAIFQGGLREIAKGILAAAVFYLLPFAVYFSWRFGYYGYIFPNTFYAKTGGTIYQWYRGAQYLSFFGLHFVCPLIPLLTAIIWEQCSCEKMACTKNLLMTAKGWLNEHYGTAVSLCLCLCYSGYIVLVGGDYMAMYRFFVPVLPFMYILLANSARVLYAEGPRSSGRPVFATALVFLGMLATFVHSTPLESRLFYKPDITHGQYRGVLHERSASQRLSAIGRFFNGYKKNEGESLATAAIGAVAYYSNLRVYDKYGIVDTHIAHQKRENIGKGLAGHEKLNNAYILVNKRPTYFMFTSGLSKKPSAFPTYLSPEVTALLQRHYEVVSVWLEDKENEESGYFSFLQRKTN